MVADERVSHLSAHVVTHHVNVLQLQRQRQLVHILGHVGGVVAAGRRLRAADTTQIQCHDGEAFCEPGHNELVFEPVLREPVNQDEGWSLAGPNLMQRRTVHRCDLGFEVAAEAWRRGTARDLRLCLGDSYTHPRATARVRATGR
jgi:hypothetical protein